MISILTNMSNFWMKLIKSNSGVSSKSFFLVVMTVIGLILLLMPVIILSIEIINNHTITTDLNGLAAYIGATSTVLVTAGITKVLGEKNERNGHNKDQNSES